MRGATAVDKVEEEKRFLPESTEKFTTVKEGISETKFMAQKGEPCIVT